MPKWAPVGPLTAGILARHPADNADKSLSHEEMLGANETANERDAVRQGRAGLDVMTRPRESGLTCADGP